jgi:phosphopentomutase
MSEPNITTATVTTASTASTTADTASAVTSAATVTATAASKRAIVIILDSVGVGALPDAADYGDRGAATLQHVARACGGLNLPTLQSLGLGNIVPVEGVAPADKPRAALDKLATQSKGKDTIAGHWELMGVVSERAFPLYPQGFPAEVMDAFTELTGHGWLGNYPASGTEIITELGLEHMRTGKPIVYTSGDSVFQIAAHKDSISLEELYRICQITRDEILVGQHACARVIARPFIGSEKNGFIRTADRHDYALSPPTATALDRLQTAGVQTFCIGKISDIFNGQGVDISRPSKSNAEGMAELERALVDTRNTQNKNSLIFANLVDFDMLWGHRRDCAGYGHGLEEFDQWLATFLPKLAPDDLFILTADHGCDPLHAGTDHTREYVPLLVYSPNQADFCTEGYAGRAGQTHYLSKVATIIEDYLLLRG